MHHPGVQLYTKVKESVDVPELVTNQTDCMNFIIIYVKLDLIIWLMLLSQAVVASGLALLAPRPRRPLIRPEQVWRHWQRAEQPQLLRNTIGAAPPPVRHFPNPWKVETFNITCKRSFTSPKMEAYLLPPFPCYL